MKIRTASQIIDSHVTPFVLQMTEDERASIARSHRSVVIIGDEPHPDEITKLADWPWPPRRRADMPEWVDFPQRVIAFQRRHFVLTGLSTQDKMIKWWTNKKKFHAQPLLRQVMQRTKGYTGSFVDVGANYGNHSIFFANFCKADRVYAIEAHPMIHEVLQFNCEHNIPSNVEFMSFQFAASSENGLIGISEVSPKNVGGTKLLAVQEGVETVQTRTLDDLIPEHDKIVLVKLDVEGHEAKVLEGAQALLSRWKPLLVIECDPEDEERFEPIHDILTPLGYRMEPDRYVADYFWSCNNEDPTTRTSH